MKPAVEEKEIKTATYAWRDVELGPQDCKEKAPSHRLGWNVTTPQFWLVDELVWAEGWKMGVDSERGEGK